MIQVYVSENTGHEASVWTEIIVSLPILTRKTLDESLDSGQLFYSLTQHEARRINHLQELR